ncbi:MAG: OmpA family protein [Alphaproteobacteria bacterium]|nr:OmpA family protein [Alphaproteobacteria bacterium]
MTPRILIASAALFSALPLLANAHDQGFYIGGGAGYVFHGDSDLNGPANNNFSVEFDGGWSALFHGGYQYGNGVRTEAELSWRHNNANNINSIDAEGDDMSWSVMLNALYDFDTGTPLTPYVGGGVGFTWLNFDKVTAPGTIFVDDDNTSFAVQGILGASYKMDANYSFFADYRYLVAIDPKFQNVAGTTVEADYNTSTVMVGMRYSFGAPQPEPYRPAPPPAPLAVDKPASPNSYLVFFDFDRYNLTEEAKRIIRAAVEGNRAGTLRFEVTGHADRSGSDAYNLQLSQRRANEVRRFLTSLGVPTQDIQTISRGENDPLVPTDDGVKEPQNRRAEIIYKR